MTAAIKLLTKITIISIILGTTYCQFGEGDAMDSYNGGGNPLFVAVGGGYGVFHSYVSSDGIHWSKGGNVSGLRDSIAYGNGIFVTVGSPDDIATSTDGVNWTIRPEAETGITTSSGIRAVLFGNGIFIISSSNGNIYTSSNGIDWNYSCNLSEPFATMCFGNGMFFGITDRGGKIEGKMYISSDGITWHDTNNPMTETDGFFSIAFGNTIFVMAGQSNQYAGLRASQNGYNWTDNMLQATGITLKSVTYGSGMFIAVGGTGNSDPTDDGVIFTSQNGFIWNGPITITETNVFLDVISSNGIFIACGGNGFISYSEDATTWSGNVGPGGNIAIWDMAVRP